MTLCKAKTIQICGTGSGVGKSVIAAGLCRIFLQEGFRVAPFKAQNMSLNSAVTPDGLEIGRAQAMQAAACGLKPHVNMNPILLKPTSNVGSQVIVHGKPVGNMAAAEYYQYKTKIFQKVEHSLRSLMAENDIVVIEGAGSPAEINLKRHDIVNMHIARLVNAPVLLVGDIDRGGVFAWLLGTVALLPKTEQKLIRGFIINKFRGDKKLLLGGLRFLERKSGKKVVGVIPYYQDITLPEEDSLFFSRPMEKTSGRSDAIKIVVVKLPHISNFTDFDVFQREPAVELSYSIDAGKIKEADCIILPGSKNTCADLRFLFDRGIASCVIQRAVDNATIVGVCGGYQMLGRKIHDPEKIESRNESKGLALLDIETHFKKAKSTFPVEVKDIKTGDLLYGYEIHHGKTTLRGRPLFMITKRGGRNVRIYDGAVNSKGNVWGTYIHGIFDNYSFRKNFLNRLRRKKGWKDMEYKNDFSLDEEFDKLADLLRRNLDMSFIKELINVV